MAHPTLHAFRPALGQGTGPPVRMTLRSETKKPRFFKDSESRLSDKNQRNPGGEPVGGQPWEAFQIWQGCEALRQTILLS